MEDDARFREPPLFYLLSPAEKIKGIHTNLVWRGQVGRPEIPAQALPMVVKHLNGGQIPLCIELACGLSAQIFKLPIPQPALVAAARSDLPDLPKQVKGTKLLLMGSHYKKPDAMFAQICDENPAAEEFIWSRVCETDTGPRGAAWDELIINPDRHSENFVFDGSQWWLFDHDLALPKTSEYLRTDAAHMSRAEMVAFQSQFNELAKQVIKRRPNSHNLHEYAKEMNKCRQELQALATFASRWTSDDITIKGIFDITSLLIGLIALRLPALTDHISRRLPKPPNPEPPSLWTSHSPG